MPQPLRVLLIEDEVLLLMQLENFFEEAGHVVAGTALSSREAIGIAAGIEADLALVDIHLADGPTGMEVGRFIAERTEMAVVFMTANIKRIPEDFLGAIGAIAKPYTQEGLRSALDYIDRAIRKPPPQSALPRSLVLAPSYAQQWGPSGTLPQGLSSFERHDNAGEV